MPDLQIAYRPVGALLPYARNARTHSDEQVAQIAASIREFGWTNPILIDDDGEPVLTDFGVAAVADAAGQYTSSVAFLRSSTSGATWARENATDDVY